MIVNCSFRSVEETKDQRNSLESFVYDTRSKLSGAYRSFASDLEKEVLQIYRIFTSKHLVSQH
ncbi:putative Heat shock protein 70kD domain superfamily [Helianthus anomalus]